MILVNLSLNIYSMVILLRIILLITLLGIALLSGLKSNDGRVIREQITVQDYCKYHINNTIESKIEPILCPNTFYNVQTKNLHYYCPRYISNKTISRYANQTIYKNTKLQWNNLLTKLIKHLNNHQVYLMGDSLTTETYYQFQCLSEFADVSNINQLIIHISNIPSEFNSSTYSFRKSIPIAQVNWYEDIRNNASIKYVVLNTGMWFNPSHFLNKQTNTIVSNVSELLDIYRIYFDVDGPYIQSLYDLKHHYNITLLWRDTTPSGSCTTGFDLRHPYLQALSQMNAIAHHSLSKIGVIIIPHIWEESLPYWNLHIENGDTVHYCLYQKQTVVNLWIKNIIESILKH